MPPEIPGIVLGEPIGRGAMGTVYRGELEDRAVAVKVLDVSRDQGDADALARAFRTEARAMGTLAHPQVIAVLDVGAASTPYVVMELADGSLSDVCGRRPWSDVRRWLGQLLDGLAHAHGRGIIHRDLKPGNVLLVGEDAKLADFGLARAFETVGSGHHERPAGTPGYMPPEQRQGRWRDIGPWTDLYALGKLALDLVTQPDGTTMQVPEGFSAWVSRLRQEAVADRYHRAADARLGLDSLPVAADVDLDPRLAGSGPAPESELAMTQPYFEDEDNLAQALAEPMAVVRPTVPEQPLTTHPAPPARRASMVGLAQGHPFGADAAQQRLWGLVHRATEAPVVVAVRGPGRIELAMWLCHQVHATGVGSIELVTHSRTYGPRSGLGGMMARELRALDLSPRRAIERLERQLDTAGVPTPGWTARALASVMAPALAAGELERVELSPPERYALVTRFVDLDSDDRLPLVWADDLHLGTDTRGWFEAMLADGRPRMLFTTLPEGELGDWLQAHGAEIIDLQAPVTADCARIQQRRLGVDEDTARRLAAVCGANVRLGRLMLDCGETADEQAIWTRCLDVLLPWGRDPRPLACAAALGMHVEAARWQDVCRRARVVWDDGLVEELVAAGIAVPVGLGGTGEWRFASEVVRRMVLDRVDPVPLHRACALAYPLDPATAVVRAQHLRQADMGQAALRALTEAMPVLAAREDVGRLEGVLLELEALGTLPEAPVWAGAVRYALGGSEPSQLPEGAAGLAVMAGEAARRRGDDDGWMRALDLAEGLAAQAAATDAAHVTWQRAAYLVRRGDQASIRAALPVLQDALASCAPSRRGQIAVELAHAHHLLGDDAARDAVLADIGTPEDGSWLAQLVRGVRGEQNVSELVEQVRPLQLPSLSLLVSLLSVLAQ